MTQKSRFTVGLTDDLHSWLFDQIGEGKRWWNPSHAITELVRDAKERQTDGHVKARKNGGGARKDAALVR